MRDRNFNFPQKKKPKYKWVFCGLEISLYVIWWLDLTFGLNLMLMSFSASFSRGSYLWHFPFSDAAAAAGVVWSVSLVSCPCHSVHFASIFFFFLFHIFFPLFFALYFHLTVWPSQNSGIEATGWVPQKQTNQQANQQRDRQTMAMA